MIKGMWKCGECGSLDIRHDAVVQWNPITEEFDILGVLDSRWCETCQENHNDDGDPEFVSVKKNYT